SSEIEVTTQYQVPIASPSVPAEHLVLERYEEIGASFTRAGRVNFFNAETGLIIDNQAVPKPERGEFSALGTSVPAAGLVVYGYTNGEVGLVKEDYQLSYPDNQRLVTPGLTYPLGQEPLVLDESGRALSVVTVQEGSSGLSIGAATDDGRLLLGRFTMQRSLFGNSGEVSSNLYDLPPLPGGAQAVQILVDTSGRHLVVADDRARLHLYDISTPEQAWLQETLDTDRGQVTAMDFLVGTNSVILGTDTGSVSQWFFIRDDQNQYHLVPVRDFDSMPGAVTIVTPEYSRKGFAAGD